MNQRVKLIVAYLGAPFLGWQRQAMGRTVQGELESAFATMTHGLELTVVGAGRTDAGVHAAGQTAHLDLGVAIPVHALPPALNGVLPDEIRVRAATPVSARFHARKSARAKLYTYRARTSGRLLPWHGLRSAQLRPLVDQTAFNQAVALLPGVHDVASFTVADAIRGSSVRHLFRVWAKHRPGGVDLFFLGEGFLRYQVRRMVGALFEVGWGQRSLAEFRALLEQPRAGSPIHTAPARGLTLEKVFYRHSTRFEQS